ncbi:hypothetical protein [Kribbella sp. NPDC006257]|uniref:DUF3885 domain-containing protein n=1 Tax=Kribbella sp. NPDC006257 TaxID=3156738 RepID=UPI0033BC34AB
MAEIPGTTAPTTPEAVALTNLWIDRLPGSRPVCYTLRGSQSDRWVRFHSLPESKRYADGLAEYRELFHRQTTVLDELLALTDGEELLVITSSWSDSEQRIERGEEIAAAVPEASPWISVAPHDDNESWSHLFVSRLDRRSPRLIKVLRLVADFATGNVLISDPQLTWLFAPYDGGVDVIAPTPQDRDALRARHQEWLSKHPGGY